MEECRDIIEAMNQCILLAPGMAVTKREDALWLWTKGAYGAILPRRPHITLVRIWDGLVALQRVSPLVNPQALEQFNLIHP
jgi:hypothetical protein